MPTYDFQCPSCSSKFEKRRSFSDNSQVPCPECGTDAEQLISAVPIIFKGSGFYVTDHRGSNGASEPTEDSGDSAKTSSEADSSKAEKPKADTTEKPAKAEESS